MTKEQIQTGNKASALTSKLGSCQRQETKFNTMFHRRMEILHIISRERHVQVDNLAFEFGVTERTIRNDIKELVFFSGIFTTQGNGGGIHAHEEWYADMVYFTEEEIEALKEMHKLLIPLMTPKLEVGLQKIFKKFTNPNHRK